MENLNEIFFGGFVIIFFFLGKYFLKENLNEIFNGGKYIFFNVNLFENLYNIRETFFFKWGNFFFIEKFWGVKI